jgi:hypothetical protein
MIDEIEECDEVGDTDVNRNELIGSDVKIDNKRQQIAG